MHSQPQQPPQQQPQQQQQPPLPPPSSSSSAASQMQSQHHHQPQQQQQQHHQQQPHNHHHHQQQQQQHHQQQQQHHHHHNQQPQHQQQSLPPQQQPQLSQQQQQHSHPSHSQQHYHGQAHHPTHLNHSHGQHHHNHHVNQQTQQAHAHQQQQHRQPLQQHPHPQQHQQQPQHHHQQTPQPHHSHQAQHSMPPAQPHHHMVPPMLHQYSHNMMYPHPIGHPHAFVPAGHVTASPYNHRPDTVNVNPQQPQQQPQQLPPTQTQQQQAQPPQTPQQAPVSINPNNMPPHMAPIPPPPVINTTNTGPTGVHSINNGPITDAHMSRIPLSQSYQVIHTYNMQPSYGLPPHPMVFTMPQNFPAHIPQPNPAMMQTRLPADMSRPPYDIHAAALTAKVPITQAAPIMATKPTVPPVQGVPAIPQPPATIGPREKKRLAIVDPKTKHVFTEDELKSSTTTSSAATTPAGSTTTTTSTTPIATPSTIPTTVPLTSTTTTISESVKPTELTKPITASTIAPTVKANPAPPKQEAVVSSNQRNLLPTAKVSSTSEPPTAVTSKESTQVTTPTLNHSKVLSRNVPSSASSTTTPKSSSSSSVLNNKEQSMAKDAIVTTLAVEDSFQALSLSQTAPPEKPVTEPKTVVQTNSNKDSPIHRVVDDDNIPFVQDGDTKKQEAKSLEDKQIEQQSTTDQTETPERRLNPKLPYAEDQFSPLNPSGHRRYTNEFLKAVGESLKLYAPEEESETRKAYDFTPSYMNRPGQYANDFRDGPIPRRNSQQALNNKQPPRRIIATQSLQPEIELKTVEKPWKPELEKEKCKAVEGGEIDTQRLLKLFRGHLNKLTPQKYDSIIEKIEALNLDGDDRLKSVIDLVFDKAVDEPGFCELYARMSKVLATKNSQFNLHLLKKCQDEFETNDLYDGLNVSARELEIERETDPSKKKLLSEELYEDMRLRRTKYLGTIKLIGEMYKLGLLVPKIIGFCIQRLLEEVSNENLECLCSLIATVGAKLASEQEDSIRTCIKNTLTVLHDFTNTKKTEKLFALESRIRFKILDTIDLSRKNWKPRMVENNPMKIDDIHREEEMRHHNNVKNNMKNDDRMRRSNPPNQYSKGRGGWN